MLGILALIVAILGVGWIGVVLFKEMPRWQLGVGALMVAVGVIVMADTARREASKPSVRPLPKVIPRVAVEMMPADRTYAEIEFEDDDEEPKASDEWKQATTEALTKILGEPDDRMFMSMHPLAKGGGSHVLVFRNHIKGVVYATHELIGSGLQVRNALGNYELMICHRAESSWGPGIVSILAQELLESPVKPWGMKNAARHVPSNSTLTSFLFIPYAEFAVRDRPGAVLLVVGVTEDEMEACIAGRTEEVVKRLGEAGVLPYTDFNRESVLKGS
ncbi:MAG: suppressor of fused domain protein [Phycisphaerae bacterium]|nr:suppressor of fused domain protein [Phycisphaerae bacterium]